MWGAFFAHSMLDLSVAPSQPAKPTVFVGYVHETTETERQRDTLVHTIVPKAKQVHTCLVNRKDNTQHKNYKRNGMHSAKETTTTKEQNKNKNRKHLLQKYRGASLEVWPSAGVTDPKKRDVVPKPKPLEAASSPFHVAFTAVPPHALSVMRYLFPTSYKWKCPRRVGCLCQTDLGHDINSHLASDKSDARCSINLEKSTLLLHLMLGTYAQQGTPPQKTRGATC